MTADPAPSLSPSAAREHGARLDAEVAAIAACQRFWTDRSDDNLLSALVALTLLRKARTA